MKRVFGVLMLVVIMPVLSAWGSDDPNRAIKRIDPDGQRRTALVIGNGDYSVGRLRNPENDAADVADMLEKWGFEVAISTNVDREQMRQKIKDFGKSLKKGGVGLFYYAGHGMQVEGENFLIPVNSNIQAEDEVEDFAVNVGMVLRKMKSAGNQMNIIILDACRNNPFSRSFRSSKQGLAQIDAPKGSLIVYATAPGSVAADGTGRNGVFTKHFLSHAGRSEAEIGLMLRNIRRDVLHETGNAQTPWESSSLTGEFYFDPAGAKERPQTVVERVYMDSLKDSQGLSATFKQKWQNALALAGKGDEVSLNQSLSELKTLAGEASANDAVFDKVLQMMTAVKKDRDLLVDQRLAAEKAEQERLQKIAEEQARIAEEKRRRAEEEAREQRERLARLEKERKARAAAKQKKQQEAEVEALLKQVAFYLAGDDKKAAEEKFHEARRILPEYSGLQKYSNIFLYAGKIWRNTLGMEFAYIPAGTFMMGSPSNEKGRDNDETRHQVTLTRGYYLQTTEVTQGQWQAVMGSNPSRCGSDCPVEEVSWNDVQEFIDKLNRKEGTNAYRLPTEAEWEYAARAGSSSAFANGDISQTGCGYDANLDAMGWYCGNADDKTHKVAQKQANAWGLYDMHGNVWEWVADWKGAYPSGSVTNPTGPSSGSRRVRRGGSWSGGARLCRSAVRRSVTPGISGRSLGFRLAMDTK